MYISCLPVSTYRASGRHKRFLRRLAVKLRSMSSVSGMSTSGSGDVIEGAFVIVGGVFDFPPYVSYGLVLKESQARTNTATNYYPRATRCDGDIVTLLLFRLSVRPSVVPSVRPSVRGPYEHDRDYTIAYFFVKLGRHVNHDERMNPIDFGGQRSKVKVTMDIYGNKLVNTIETTSLHISLSNLADMLTMMRE